ncbi:hypothetical protein ACJROX_23840 [Pseudalkalibacillus sp. A8]|uniref:hypothetical protein n=1 Tax=Pseudalkalibacillus sp. A8 TaxID=3382641 RepID=UPI0038B4D63A
MKFITIDIFDEALEGRLEMIIGQSHPSLVEKEKKMDKETGKKKQHRNDKKNSEDELYGVDSGESLQSVNFATTENSYLNEHFQEDSDH